MPILDDVDGILLELLLLPTPSLPDEKRCSRQNKTPANRHCYRHPALRIPEDCKHETEAVRTGVPAVDENNGAGEARHAVSGGSSGRTLVGAVALLLSDVTTRWRTMESPLFDSAGSVVGTIKMAARVLGGGDDEAGRGTALERKVAAPATAVERAPTGGVDKTKIKSHRKVPQNYRRVQDSTQTPTCCSHGGSHFTHRAGHEPWVSAPRESLPEIATVLKERSLARDSEMTPRAVILYRGIRLPYRWFRSSSAAAMGEALRETLGGWSGQTDDLLVKPGFAPWSNHPIDRSSIQTQQTRGGYSALWCGVISFIQVAMRNCNGVSVSRIRHA